LSPRLCGSSEVIWFLRASGMYKKGNLVGAPLV
jgi:hypothetical protein